MATEDFFRARLDSMIDMRHPLAVLATRMPWTEIEGSLAPLLAHKDRSGRLIQDADCRPQIGDLQTVARQNGIDWRHQKSSHSSLKRSNNGRPHHKARLWRASYRSYK